MKSQSTWTSDELKELLEEKFEQFNSPDFIESDPISIPHAFERKEDQEIAGLLAAILSWGRRDLIIRAAFRLMERMDMRPYEFAMGASDREIARLDGFVYRTFQEVDAQYLMKGFRRIYTELGGLEAVMTPPADSPDTQASIMQLREAIGGVPHFPQRTYKHLANPLKGSSAKRINMFLRWMVRSDGKGVDLGIWKSWKANQLICPLDVHVGNVARKLGLLTRQQDDWKAAVELTERLRQLDPVDPVKYDFSLFGLGVFEGFAKDC